MKQEFSVLLLNCKHRLQENKCKAAVRKLLGAQQLWLEKPPKGMRRTAFIYSSCATALSLSHVVLMASKAAVGLNIKY